MNNNINRENDIYQLLIDDKLYYLSIEGVHYNNYIIYERDGIIYRIYIHDNLLGNRIKFFIDSNDEYTNEQTIILAYKEDVPIFILEEESNIDEKHITINNENIALIGDENNDIFENNDMLFFEYESITLEYDANNNAYRFGNNLYEIHRNAYEKLNGIIRHFKVIKKRFNGVTNNIIKYCLYNKTTNKLYNWFNSERKAIEAKNNYTSKYGDNLKLVVEHIKYKGLYQDPNFYGDKLYNDEGINTHNQFNDEPLNFGRYYSINEFKEHYNNYKAISISRYGNHIHSDFTNSDSFEYDIDYNLENSDYFYIRFAPKNEIKDIQAKRVFQIRHIYTDYNDEPYLNILVQKSEMPIYNDNFIYSETKCKEVDNELNLNMIK